MTTTTFLRDLRAKGACSEGYACRCGCGAPAPLAQRNNARLGHRKGMPLPFRAGHNKRGHADLTRYLVVASGCWEWIGPRDHKGYGRIQVDRVHRQAHRVLYERTVGAVAPSLHLDHLCRNRACVNPDHLEPVTPSENNLRSHAARRADRLRALFPAVGLVADADVPS